MFDNAKFPNENREFFGWVVDYKEEDGRILYKVRVPNLWGPNVSDDDLIYCPAELPPTLGSATTSGGALDKGQFVRVKIDTGQGPTGQFTIRSTYHSTLRSNSEMPGNFSWNKMYGDLLAELPRTGVRLPPDIQKKVNEKGVEVAELVEKGEFALRDLIGIASHGTQNPLNGVMIPQMKSVRTALAQAENALTSDILDKLPGSQFKFSDLFDTLGKEGTKEVLGSLPDRVHDALLTVVALTQNYSSETSSLEIMRINPAVFTAEVVTLLKGTDTITDLLGKISRIMSGDVSLTGMDKLPGITEIVSGLFGDKIISISPTGQITNSNSNDYSAALDAFTSFMGSFSNADGTVFDKVEDFPAVVSRLKPEVGKVINTTLRAIQEDRTHPDMTGFIGT